MAQDTTRPKPDTGERLPRITGTMLGGGTLTLPDDFAGSWGIVLIYRGHW